MIRKRLGRFATVFIAASTALMVLGIGTVSATPPGWKFVNPKAVPPQVKPGNDAGYSFTILNDGRSNISQLFLTDSIEAAPTYLFTSRGTDVCVTSPDLLCSFGALNAGDSIDVVIAYSTVGITTSTLDVTFQLNGTGATFSDGDKQSSHGDTKDQKLTTALIANKNFVGGFTPDLVTYSNDPDLGPKNIQSGSVDSPAAHIGVSLEDGLSDSTFSCTGVPGCARRFGEWARVYVADGATFSGGIHIRIVVLGSKVPSGATVDNIVLLHVPTLADGSLGTPYAISTRCSTSTLPTVPGVECITVTKVGNNFQIDGWLNSNGGAKGGY